MAKKMLLRKQPSKMWKLYDRMLISPYKPSRECRHCTSDYAILASPHKQSKLRSQRNLLKELNSVSLKIIKGSIETHLAGIRMVQCDNCQQQYHQKCVSVTKKQAETY